MMAEDGPWAWFASLTPSAAQEAMAVDRSLAILLVELIQMACDAGERVPLFEWEFLEHVNGRVCARSNAASKSQKRAVTTEMVAVAAADEIEATGDADATAATSMDAAVTAGIKLLERACGIYNDHGGAAPTAWDGVTLERAWLADPSRLLKHATTLSEGRFLSAPPPAAPGRDRSLRGRSVAWLAEMTHVHLGALLLGAMEASLWSAHARAERGAPPPQGGARSLL